MFSLILTAKYRIPTLQAGMCNLEIPLLYKKIGVIAPLICHPLLKTKGMRLMLIAKKGPNYVLSFQFMYNFNFYLVIIPIFFTYSQPDCTKELDWLIRD